MHIVMFPSHQVSCAIIMSHYCYYPRTMLLYRYGDCSSDKCNSSEWSPLEESISTGKRHHVNSINVIVLLHVIYYNLLSSAIYTIYRGSKSETIHYSEYPLEYLRSSHYLAEQLRVCHLDMPFNHITEWKDCINHWLYLSLADPTYYFFQTCLRSLRRPQQISSFEEKISEVNCGEIAGGRTRGNKCPPYLQ